MYEFTQHTLINATIYDVGLKDAKVKPVPAKVSLQLHAFKDEPSFDLDFNYRSAVGKLNYQAQTTRPAIMYTTHQIAKYSSDPRQLRGEAILYLVCYLKRSRNLGLKFKPDPKKGFECYCDTNFSGNWNKVFAPMDPSTAKSQVVGSSSMQDALSHGLINFSHKLLYLLQKASTLLCHNPYMTTSLS